MQAGTEELAAPAASGERRPRPGLLLIVWALLLLLLAAVAPVAQSAFGVPFELLSLVMLVPALAGLVVVARPQWMPAWWARVPLGRVLAVAVGATVAVTIFVATLSLLTGQMPSWKAPGIGSPLWLFLCLQTIGVLCEEIGWRGVVQRAGEQFARPAVVSLIAGLLFGVTHLGYWSLGPIPVTTFALTAALMSLTITTLFEGNLWQRMIPAVIVHLGVNLGVASLAEAGEPLATTFFALMAAAAMLASAAAIKVMVCRRNRSGRNDLFAPAAC